MYFLIFSCFRNKFPRKNAKISTAFPKRQAEISNASNTTFTGLVNTYSIGYSDSVRIGEVTKTFSPWTIVCKFTHIILTVIVCTRVGIYKI